MKNKAKNKATISKISVSTNVTCCFVILFLLYMLWQTKNNAEDQMVLANQVAYNEMQQIKEEYKEEMLGLSKENWELSREYEDLKGTMKSTIEKLKIMDYATEYTLEVWGIKDPDIITEDLKNHPELIPFEGSLGGTMFFESLYLINEKWVYVGFSDGHSMGIGLYEYTVNEDQSITWKVIEAEIRKGP